MITGLKALAVALLLLAFAGKGLRAQDAQTSTPQTLSYQGVLKTTTGNQTAGNRLLKVTLYSDADGNNKLWQNTMNTPVDENGVFNTLLGTPDNPLPGSAAMDKPIWLGISIDNGPELRPLSQITATAYALNVADNAITSQKLATGAVTADKLDMNYVSSISVNGQKVTGKASDLNIVSGDGVDLVYDDASKVLLVNSSGSSANTNGKGANAESVATEWQLAGNTLTGSTYSPVEWFGSSNFEVRMKSGNQIALRLEPGGATPNVVGGDANNLGDNTGLGGDFIGGGKNNTVKSAYGGLSAGNHNTIDTFADDSYIGAGVLNEISGTDAGIVAGDSNLVDNLGGFVGAGSFNRARYKFAGIVAGQDNLDSAQSSVIGGGLNDSIPFSASVSFIGAGTQNLVTEEGDFVGTGDHNAVNAFGSAIVAGGSGSIGTTSYQSFIGAGYQALIDDACPYSAIVGGTRNKIHDGYSIIGGGDTNVINSGSDYSIVGGGYLNTVSSNYSTILGGYSNTLIANSGYEVIGGGKNNTIEDFYPYSVIVGGRNNRISSTNSNPGGWNFMGAGDSNLMNGFGAQHGDDPAKASAIVAGWDDTLNESFSFIGAGKHNRIWEDGDFIGAGTSNVLKNTSENAIGSGRGNSIDISTNAGNGIGSAFIGSGDTNVINQKGVMAAIPSGDHLTANEYAQTVVGFHNIVPPARVNDTASASTHGDDPLFIVGNGINVGGTLMPSDAAFVSYNGHLAVSGNAGSGGAQVPPPPKIAPSIEGTTYIDNTIIAWGNVAGKASLINAALADVGVLSVVWGGLGTGQYTITLNVNDQGGGAHTFTGGDCAIVASVSQGLAGVPDLISVQPITGAGTFIVTVFKFVAGVPTPNDDAGFMFHVIAR